MTSQPVEFSKNLFENEEYGERTVAGVISTTTQHCNTKQTTKLMTSQPVEFSKNLFENEEYGETVAGMISTTTQRRDTNGEEKTTEKTTTGESLEPS